ncbi:hypothetical protein ACFYO2_05740 [Streptomyces sp. NPDC006602]|uniref:hypothetical protein n=1 Tax=Streptomyces sp. NPDC006602 TaxID=3364751 RepID=UPI0036898F7E
MPAQHEPLQLGVRPGDVGLLSRGSGGVAGGDGGLDLVRAGAAAPQGDLEQGGALFGLRPRR